MNTCPTGNTAVTISLPSDAPKKSEKEQHKTPLRERASITEGDQVIAETIIDLDTGVLRFITKQENGEFRRLPVIGNKAQRVKPPSSCIGMIQSGVVHLPSDVGTYSSTEALLKEVQEYIHRYADFGDFIELVVSHYVLMSWVYDRFDAVPYLRFIGEPGTGKTRLLLIAQQLCYRAILMGPGSTVSPFFRLMEMFKGTTILDEADYRNSDMDADMIKILNSGYQRGTPLVRSERVGQTYIPTSYDVYGPKIIATRKPFDDRALETRCLTFQMVEKEIRDGIPKQLPPSFAREGQALRNKLLAFRFAEFGRIAPSEGELHGMDNRRAQIGASIACLICDPKFKKDFVNYLRNDPDGFQSEGQRGLVIEAFILCATSLGEIITLRSVADIANSLSTPDEAIKPKTVARIVRSLGFRTERRSSGVRIRRDAALLARVIERYGQDTDSLEDEEEVTERTSAPDAGSVVGAVPTDSLSAG
jgi:hypothetical protein